MEITDVILHGWPGHFCSVLNDDLSTLEWVALPSGVTPPTRDQIEAHVPVYLAWREAQEFYTVSPEGFRLATAATVRATLAQTAQLLRMAADAGAPVEQLTLKDEHGADQSVTGARACEILAGYAQYCLTLT